MNIAFKLKALALAGVAATWSFGASAATVNNTANVVFIVDESGSMAGEQAFLKDTVIGALDAGLDAAGVSNRSYGVVGYGRSANGGAPRVVGGGLADAGTTETNLDALTVGGGFEDGYQAIDYALTNFAYTAGAAINFILVTDEDRDVGDSTLNYANISQRLQNAKILLNAVVSNAFSSDDGTALGVDSDGEAYVADGSGGFSTATGGMAGSGSGSTTADYVDLALATGGAAWDLNQLRAGGDVATSFATAFIDIKVQEIISQPPSEPNPNVIPLPAGMPLLLGGLGLLGFLKRRRRAAAA